MGADLYIRSISNKLQATYRPLIDAAIAERDRLAKERREEVVFNRSFEPHYKDPEIQKYQEQIEEYYTLITADGYFRDPYNSWDLLWRYDLSWWKDVGALIEQYEKRNGIVTENNDYMSSIGDVEIRKLLDWIPEGDVPIADLLEDNPEFLEHQTREEIQEYFNGRRNELIKFLNRALELGEPIECSI